MSGKGAGCEGDYRAVPVGNNAASPAWASLILGATCSEGCRPESVAAHTDFGGLSRCHPWGPPMNNGVWARNGGHLNTYLKTSNRSAIRNTEESLVRLLLKQNLSVYPQEMVYLHKWGFHCTQGRSSTVETWGTQLFRGLGSEEPRFRILL